MFCGFCGPQTKSIMMFGCNDHLFKARCSYCTYPLFCIKQRRIKNRWAFSSIAPFFICIRIHTKMKERSQLQLLPTELPCRWCFKKERIRFTCKVFSAFKLTLLLPHITVQTIELTLNHKKYFSYSRLNSLYQSYTKLSNT